MVKISKLVGKDVRGEGSRSSKNKSWAWKYMEAGKMVRFGYHTCSIRKIYSGNLE
jgi:hypothetical protein